MTIFIFSFIIWAVIHSITADARVKTWTKDRIGAQAYAGLYRLGYNLFAFISILPVLAVLWAQVPNTLLWRIPDSFIWLAWLLQFIGLVGLIVALLQTDVWEFVGVRQAVNYFRGKDHLPPAKLVTDGLYAFVRHPLYFFSLLILWPNPVVTWQTLLLNVMATIYLWAGSRVEEKRLTAVFGDAYKTYKQRVPGLLPLKWPL